MPHTDPFTAYRDLLFHIAYRMVGTVMDAEDLVQDAYLKWQRVELATVDNPKGYLTTLLTRLCLDHLRAARHERETYIGPWLPAPLLTRPEAFDRLEMRESISMAFLYLLEALNPPQRAAFLLRDVFDFEYAEIADTLDTSPANCRQMVSRARQHLAAERSRHETTPEQHQAIVTRFLDAVQTGDIGRMVDYLAEDVIVYSDGGGAVRAATRPVEGPAAAAALMRGLARFVTPTTRISVGWANAMPALILHEAGKVTSVSLFAVDRAGRIRRVFHILNPAKLPRINARMP